MQEREISFARPEEVVTFLADGASRLKILVVGDLMLDKYYVCTVTRISPEAPVPVARVVGEKLTLGGAANVAHNLIGLGCQTFIGGVVGDDKRGRDLRDLLKKKGIDDKGVFSEERQTTTKLRILALNQQLLRLDFEETNPIGEVSENALKNWFMQTIAEHPVSGVVVSDYSKGVCTSSLCQAIISECIRRDIPVLADPKGIGWQKFVGATFLTPNLRELNEAMGARIPNEDDAVAEYAWKARRRFRIEHLVVTRAEKGLSLVNEGGVTHIGTRAREVFDVSGAGDTVSAVLISAVAGGLHILDGLRLANLAAGLVVSKVGTYAVTNSELLDAVLDYGRVTRGSKIRTLPEVVCLVERWRTEGQTIVFTNGCFDLLHAGHVSCLRKAKELGDRLIVGLNSDSSVRKLKGPKRPILDQTSRARLLEALECVDCIVIFDEETPEKLIRTLKPDVLVKGGDYRAEEVVGREYVDRVEIVPLEDGYSTSSLIDRIISIYCNWRRRDI